MHREVLMYNQAKMAPRGRLQAPRSKQQEPNSPSRLMRNWRSASVLCWWVHDTHVALWRELKQYKVTENVDYIGNVHVLKTGLSLCQVHKATVERYIRKPLCEGLMPLYPHCTLIKRNYETSQLCVVYPKSTRISSKVSFKWGRLTNAFKHIWARLYYILYILNNL